MGEFLKGYKGFNKDFTCRGKQYKENTVFEEDRAEICNSGMHFCVNPLDVLDHYGLVDNDASLNEFAPVEALAESKTDDNKKFCTTKLKVGVKLGFPGFVKACVDFMIEKTKFSIDDAASGDASQLAASGYASQLAASGYASKLAASGYASKLAASGDASQLAASGYASQLAASGYASKLAASGNRSQLAASGDASKLAASGDASQLAASGYASQLAASGYASKLAASGNRSQLAASGDASKLAASGYASQLAASGYASQLAASGYASVCECTGEDSVICCAGNNSKAKAKNGSWITLAEWEWNDEKERYVPKCVKTEFVDGEKIKEDTFYKLIDGEFTEV